ncbi:hypothetical protein DCAR_0208732 [Daucus carota subsp. sativus]|uniref:Uncharacterized protein n=1 Tax=Daucus carota subsp. sativus TaxID=79200 RepID=A0A166ERV2_DAUCS|nr:PREDICTED: uncharacterized protein LOC108206654 [Daucus carota subsp. sativus]WOG89494.1 hypothetical protein DCAR_0208732 [Daucus carota subsp. sativus]
MARTSNILLDLEADNPASSSIESKLLFCVNDDLSRQPKVAKSIQPEKKPAIRPLPKSQVLDKLKDFLPVMSEANKKLQLAAMDNTKVFDIESIEDDDSPHIEMDLMLGVADLNTPEAIAAAESAINGNQPASSSVATSESSDSSDEDEVDDNHSESTSDDEHKEQRGSNKHDQGKNDRSLKCPPVNIKRAKSIGTKLYEKMRKKQPNKRPKIVEL